MTPRVYRPDLHPLASIVLWLCSAFASAEPDKINGMASYESLNEEQFIAALYLETPERDPRRLLGDDYPARMEIRVTADRISRRRLVNLWVQSITINNDADTLTARADDLIRFNNIFQRSLRRNDHLVLTHRPGRGVEVNLNGVTLNSIPSGEFFRVLLSAWIGEVPLSSSFREGILGVSPPAPSLRERFSALQPSPQRRRETASWLAPPKQKTGEIATPAPARPLPSPQPQKPLLKPVSERVTTTAPRPDPPAEAAETPPEAQTTRTAGAQSPAPPPTRATKPTQTPAPPAEAPGGGDAEDKGDDSIADLDFDAQKEDFLRRQAYYSRLVKHIYQYKDMPAQALRQRLNGTVTVAIRIDRRGQLLSSDIVRTSRHSVFNEQAAAAVERAEPYPEIPTAIPENSYSFTVPLVYGLSR